MKKAFIPVLVAFVLILLAAAYIIGYQKGRSSVILPVSKNKIIILSPTEFPNH